jgi:hypothetical protein
MPKLGRGSTEMVMNRRRMIRITRQTRRLKSVRLQTVTMRALRPRTVSILPQGNLLLLLVFDRSTIPFRSISRRITILPTAIGCRSKCPLTDTTKRCSRCLSSLLTRDMSITVKCPSSSIRWRTLSIWLQCTAHRLNSQTYMRPKASGYQSSRAITCRTCRRITV